MNNPRSGANRLKRLLQRLELGPDLLAYQTSNHDWHSSTICFTAARRGWFRFERGFLTQRRNGATQTHLEPGRRCAVAPPREKSFYVGRPFRAIDSMRLQKRSSSPRVV